MRMPWLGNAENALVSSISVTSCAPSAIDRKGRNSVEKPNFFAYAATCAGPSMSITLTAGMLRDCSRACRSVIVPWYLRS